MMNKEKQKNDVNVKIKIIDCFKSREMFLNYALN